MLTFLIDIHGEVADLEMAAPFLYPVNNKLKQIKLVSSDFTRIGDIFFPICRHLERYYHDKWQIIFLINPGLEHQNLLVGGMTYFMLLIQEKVLTPLRKQRLTPTKTILLAIDSVERNEKGRPENHNLAVRWEMDVQGYIKDSQSPLVDFTFTQDEISKLNTHFGRSLNISSERFGGNFNDLSMKFQSELIKRCERLEKSVNSLIEQKIEKLRANRFTDEMFNQYFIQTLTGIRDTMIGKFKKTLLENPESASTIHDFNAELLFKNILRKHSGVHSECFDKSLTIIRFPFPSFYHNNEFQKKVLMLTLLIIAIAENCGDIRFISGESYETELISDESSLNKLSLLLFNYQKCLSDQNDSLKQRTSVLNPTSSTQYREITEKCSESSPDVSLPKDITFGFFQDYYAQNNWTNWFEDVRETINKIIRLSQNKINVCIEKNFSLKPVEGNHEITDLKSFREELQRRCSEELIKLSEQDFFFGKDREFEDILRQSDREMKVDLKKRPVKNSFFKVTLFLWVCLVFFFLPPLDIDLMIIFAISAGLPTVLLFSTIVSTKLVIKSMLTKKIRNVKDEAIKCVHRLKQKFEKQKEYLRIRYNLNIAWKNLQKVEKILESNHQEKLLITFHLKELENHLIRARQMMELFPIKDKTYENAENVSYWNIELEKPVFQNKLYAPASYSKNYQNHKYKIGVENGFYERESQFILGIDFIHFKKDIVYSSGE